LFALFTLPKRLGTSIWSSSTTSQDMVLFVATAARTSNPVSIFYSCMQ
jgi:hypothetical protein